MKKGVAILCILTIVSIFYYACKKAGAPHENVTIVGSNSNLAAIIAAKRDFFDNVNVMKTTTIESVQGGTDGLDPLKSYERICRWDRAKLVHLSGRDVVIVPLFFDDKLSVQSNIGGNQSKDPINSIFKMMVYKDETGKVQVEIVSGYKDLNSQQSNFSGIAYVQNWSGDFIKGFSFGGGQVQSLTRQSDPRSKTTAPSDYAQQNTVCNYIDWYICGSGGCTFESQEFLGCTTTITGGSGQTISYYDYGVAANTNVTPSPDSITNELKTICFSAVLASLQANGLKSELNNIITNVFGALDTVNLILNEKPFLAGGVGVDASTRWTHSGRYFTATTTLNDQALAHASREYVAEVMFHEVIHAYLDYNSTVHNELLQHCEMINSYVDCELSSLQEIFPDLSNHDGLCMILQGMGDVQQFDTTTFNTVLAHYNLTLDDVNTTGGNYKSGQAGTSCSVLN